MTQMAPDPGQEKNRTPGFDSVADELKHQSDRLRQLAEELKAQAEAQAEMRENYPHFKRAVYAALREQFARELAPLPDKELEAMVAEEGALPLDAIIGELEQLAEGSNDAE